MSATSDRKEVLQRLGRIEGQVRGIAAMVEQDRYCTDVLTQVASATKALQGVALALLDQHLRRCVAEATASGDPADRNQKVADAVTAVQRLMRT
jgi:CsoR family transcriptional regulator, copper-sensing transcriptional repressor